MPDHRGQICHGHLARHQEEVVAIGDILLKPHRKTAQLAECQVGVVENIQRILPVQGDQRIGNVCQQHQRTIIDGRRCNLDGADGF